MKGFQKIVFVASITLLLIACGNKENGNEPNINNAQDQTALANHDVNSTSNYPLTIQINGETIKIDEQPEKMLPLSLEVTEILLDLVDSDKLVATTRGIDDPILSSKSAIAASIDNRIQAASNMDPEELIAYDTDFIVMTKMYGQEADAKKALDKLNIPILAFDAFVTWDDYLDAYEIIGEAIGQHETAQANIEKMREEVKSIQNEIHMDQSPSLLVLSEVGGDMGPLMMGPTNISYDLIQLAGATPAVDKIHLARSTPASMEQIIKMDPDYILFVDFFGKGKMAFANLSDDPAWETLRAVQNEQTMILDAKYVINPNNELIEGLSMIVDWLYAN